MGDLDFLLAMRRLTTTVHVVTCGYEGQKYGMTATAVLSVCNDPPAMLTCVNKSSSLFQPMTMVERFCINLLKVGQQDVASAFSGKMKGDERFECGKWSASNETPYLVTAQASIFCETREFTSFGTHGIFIGEVCDLVTDRSINPLLYEDGKFVESKDIGS